jgi:CRISPR-associated endoribonuclease Cas6
VEVRSPIFELLDTLEREIKKRDFIELDYNRLYLIEVSFSKISKPIFSAKTVTPIVISISDNLAEKYGVVKRSKTFYWTPKLDFSIFVEALNRNMVRKWNSWNEKKYPEDLEIITGYQLLKNFPIGMRYKKGKVWGTLWELQFNVEFDEITRFSYLSGFGEKSGSGFGFLRKF